MCALDRHWNVPPPFASNLSCTGTRALIVAQPICMLGGQGELLQQGARCLANLSLNEANEAALVASNRADKLGPIMIAICAHEDVVREREC